MPKLTKIALLDLASQEIATLNNTQASPENPQNIAATLNCILNDNSVDNISIQTTTTNKIIWKIAEKSIQREFTQCVESFVKNPDETDQFFIIN